MAASDPHPRARRSRPRWKSVVRWLGLGLLFLLFWETKWPQYVLILTAPLCMAAAAGAERVGSFLMRRLRRAA